MEPRIIVWGFEADPHTLHYIKTELCEFLELCPDESSVDIKIAKTSNHFEMVARVYYLGGGYTAKGSSSILTEAIHEVFDQLYDQMHSWRRYRNSQITGDNQGPSEQNSLRVLIIDDEMGSTRLLETCLHDLGCRTTSVTTGTDAVREISAGTYDLVFLDWLMPDMTGGEALSEIEKTKELSHRTPVITYSSHPHDEFNIPTYRNFRILGHWEKSTSLPDLYLQIKQTITQVAGVI